MKLSRPVKSLNAVNHWPKKTVVRSFIDRPHVHLRLLAYFQKSQELPKRNLLGYNFSIFHMQDTITQLRQFFIVSDDEKCLVEFVSEIEKQLMQLLCIGRIKVARRFISHDDVGFID